MARRIARQKDRPHDGVEAHFGEGDEFVIGDTIRVAYAETCNERLEVY
jgi:hypothetical protein